MALHTVNLPPIGIGLHTGELVQEMENFFGKDVILASGIADQAQGGEILVSSIKRRHARLRGSRKKGGKVVQSPNY